MAALNPSLAGLPRCSAACAPASRPPQPGLPSAPLLLFPPFFKHSGGKEITKLAQDSEVLAIRSRGSPQKLPPCHGCRASAGSAGKFSDAVPARRSGPPAEKRHFGDTSLTNRCGETAQTRGPGMLRCPANSQDTPRLLAAWTGEPTAAPPAPRASQKLLSIPIRGPGRRDTRRAHSATARSHYSAVGSNSAWV